MPRGLTIEIDDGDAVRPKTATQLGNLLEALAESGNGIARLRMEIETEGELVLPFFDDSGGDASVLENGKTDAAKPITVSTEAAVDESVESEAAAEAEAESEEMYEQIADITLNPDTRRWILSAILYHAAEPVTIADIVEVSQETDWEMDQSSASAELYNMYKEDIVERHGSPYRYELSPIGEKALEHRSETEAVAIEPHPF